MKRAGEQFSRVRESVSLGGVGRELAGWRTAVRKPLRGQLEGANTVEGQGLLKVHWGTFMCQDARSGGHVRVRNQETVGSSA